MLVDLIIDGNYLLNRLVFTLHKNNLLFGALRKSLDMSISNYRKLYPFRKIYLVSDSKEKSWRKNIYSEYKAKRKRDSDIDWDFVFDTYFLFKEDVDGLGVKVLEAPSIEGDDWISFLVEKSNNSGVSTIIISNDYDIKQLIRYSIDPLVVNIMSNEMRSMQRVFLPKNYQLFMNQLNKIQSNDDIFSLNDNNEFMLLVKSFTERCEVHDVDPVECLIIKLISGDIGDNIMSVWSVSKNGKTRGIAEKGAKVIFDNYVSNFGDPRMDDPDLVENIADVICEKKKLPKKSMDLIKDNIEKNMKLIVLDMNNIPNVVLNKMQSIYATE